MAKPGRAFGPGNSVFAVGVWRRLSAAVSSPSRRPNLPPTAFGSLVGGACGGGCQVSGFAAVLAVGVCASPSSPSILFGFFLRSAPSPKKKRREIAGDVAVTFPLKDAHAVAAARSSPGGAATAYEAHKVARYGVLCAEEGMTLAPLVVDVFGAWGATGLHMLHMIATEWSKRSRLHRTISTQLVFNAINVEVQRGVARLLLANAVPAGSV